MERPLQRPAWGRRGREPGRGSPPPLPPPAALTHWQPTGPRPKPAAARQPPRHEYTLGERWGQQMAGRRPAGQGGRRAAERPPQPHPLAPPPQLEGHRSDPPPPRSRGDAPPPPEGTATRGGGGGMRLDLHTARPSSPSRLLPRGWRLTGEPSPARRGGARTTPWGTAAHHNSMGAVPPMTPPMTIAHSREGRGGVQV